MISKLVTLVAAALTSTSAYAAEIDFAGNLSEVVVEDNGQGIYPGVFPVLKVGPFSVSITFDPSTGIRSGNSVQFLTESSGGTMMAMASLPGGTVNDMDDAVFTISYDAHNRVIGYQFLTGNDSGSLGFDTSWSFTLSNLVNGTFLDNSFSVGGSEPTDPPASEGGSGHLHTTNVADSGSTLLLLAVGIGAFFGLSPRVRTTPRPLALLEIP